MKMSETCLSKVNGSGAIIDINSNEVYNEIETSIPDVTLGKNPDLVTLIPKEHNVRNINTHYKYIHHEYEGNTYITFFACELSYESTGTVCEEELTERELDILLSNSKSHGFLKALISDESTLETIRYYKGFMAVHINHAEQNNTISYFIPNYTTDSVDVYSSLCILYQETLDSTDLKVLERINNRR